MTKEIIETPKAPAPIGPYSQAVKANGFVFVSGQVALVPSTGELQLTDVETETRQVMENVKAVLQAAGSDLRHVVKTSIFLSDMGLFAKVNEIYGSYFSSEFPARETVAVKTLPRNVNVEISVIALGV